MADITENDLGFFVPSAAGGPPIFMRKDAMSPDRVAALRSSMAQMYGNGAATPSAPAPAPADPSQLQDFQAPKTLPPGLDAPVPPQQQEGAPGLPDFQAPDEMPRGLDVPVGGKKAPYGLSVNPESGMVSVLGKDGKPAKVMTLNAALDAGYVTQSDLATIRSAKPGALSRPYTEADQNSFAPAPMGDGSPSSPAGIASQFTAGALPGSRPSGSGAEGMYLKGIRQQQQAAQQGAAIGAQRAAEQATYQQHMADRLDSMAAEQAQKQGDRQRFLDGQMNDLGKMMATFNSQKVDPSHFWADKGTGAKVAAAIGIALGAFGQAFTGGQNAALQIVQTAIDRDIDAQKANLAKGQQDIQNRASLIQAYRNKFQDDAQADAATRATMLQAASQKAAAMAAKYDAPEMKAKAQQVAGELQTQAAQALDAFKQRSFERAMQTAQLGMQSQELGLQMANIGKDRFVPGLGYALDKDAAKTLREKKVAYDDVSGKLDRMIALREKYGAETMDRSAVSEMKSLSKQLMLSIQQSSGLTRLSDQDIKVLNDIQGGDPTSLGYVLPALQSLKKSINESFKSQAGTYLDPSLSGTSGGIPMRPLR